MFIQLILTNTVKAFVVTSHNDTNFIFLEGLRQRLLR